MKKQQDRHHMVTAKHEVLPELKFEELPDIPKMWIDLLRSGLSLPPAVAFDALQSQAHAAWKRAAQRENLLLRLKEADRACSSPMLESIEKLKRPESVVVVANFYPSLLGGPLFQYLKCLTAIKVCRELADRGIPAVPVCWISAAYARDFPMRAVSLLDPESELHRLQLQDSDMADFSPEDPLPRDRISSLLSQVEEVGHGTFDAEILSALREAFVSETTLSCAAAHLVTDLMKEWGMVVLVAAAPFLKSVFAEALAPFPAQAEKTESLLQTLVLPVVAYVIDPCEADSYAASQAVFDEFGLPRPMAWPQSSATIVDARCRRILERYGLSLRQLYSGEEEVIAQISAATPQLVPAKLDSLKIEVETRIAELEALIPGEFAKTASSCKEKIIYQLEKLREQCTAARERKGEAVRRQIHKVCGSLAPNRRVQEKELAGIQIPLRYSRAGLRALYEKLDIMKFEHQLIPMD